MEFIIGSLYVNDKSLSSGTLIVLCTEGNNSLESFEGVVVELGSYDESIGYSKGQYLKTFAKNAFALTNKKVKLKNK